MLLTNQTVVDEILNRRRSIPHQRSLLAAVTGIDACGKGYVAALLLDLLQQHGLHTVVINVDGWLHLPQQRFDSSNPSEHFYQHAIRFEEMFTTLILPLRNQRSLRIIADYTEETATEYSQYHYDFQDVDIILLEGIYLLKRAFQSYYDLSLWIECRFETALERAVSRAQEGLSAEETIRVYRNLYFPAQEIHFQRDQPRDAATFILQNDL